MDPHAALNILNQATAQFRGTREEHIMVQQALEVLKNLVNHAQEEPPTPTPPAPLQTKKSRK